MSRFLTVLAALMLMPIGCADLGLGGSAVAESPSTPPAIAAQPPPGVRLRSPADALLTDQTVGAPRTGGSRGTLTAAEAASQQPDQEAALAEFVAWGWLGGADRSWSGVAEMIVITARSDGAMRALAVWTADAGQGGYTAGACSATERAGLDDCSLGLSGGRALVVARLGTAVFRLDCPAADAERLTVAQVAALHA